MHYWGGSSDIVLQMGHEMRSVSLNLLVRGDCAEDDFSKPAVSEFSKCYSANDFQRHFHDGQRQVSAIIDETCDVIFGHFGELLLEQAFETRKDNRALSGGIVVDHSVFDLTISLFHHCRL